MGSGAPRAAVSPVRRLAGDFPMGVDPGRAPELAKGLGGVDAGGEEDKAVVEGEDAGLALLVARGREQVEVLVGQAGTRGDGVVDRPGGSIFVCVCAWIEFTCQDGQELLQFTKR